MIGTPENQPKEFNTTVRWIDVWWNAEAQIWTLQYKNEDNFQVGDAGFAGRKWEAILFARVMAEAASSIECPTVGVWVQNRTRDRKYTRRDSRI